jgi:hypothetical protein
MKSFGRLLLAFLVPLAVAAVVFLPPATRREGTRERSAEASRARPRDPSGRTSAESRALASALAAASASGGPAIRAAGDEDAAPSEERSDLVDLYGTYHPYVVRGDLNGDGQLDFAQAFVETGNRGWFHVAVFFGRGDGSFEPPVWVERSVSLSPGDISIERTLLTIVPDLSLDAARRYRWDPVEARFVDADADAPQVDAEEPGAGGPPRLRI